MFLSHVRALTDDGECRCEYCGHVLRLTLRGDCDWKGGACPNRRVSGCLAGAALKKKLRKWKWLLKKKALCKCNQIAARMDVLGCDWCEAHVDELVEEILESVAAAGGLRVPIPAWWQASHIRRALFTAIRQARKAHADSSGSDSNDEETKNV